MIINSDHRHDNNDIDLEVVVDVAGHVGPTLAHGAVPLEGGGHGGGEAGHVALVQVEVDPAQVVEVIPANLLPQAEAVWGEKLLINVVGPG